MTTGDGGMMVTNDPELFKDIRAMRWVGIDKDTWKSAMKYTEANHDAMHWFYEISVLGYKYNMNDLAASIGLVQLKKLPGFNNRRGQIIKRYLEGLKDLTEIVPMLPFEPDIYPYQMFGIRAQQRDNLMIYLKAKGIATGCHYTPLTLQPLFSQYAGSCNYIEKEAQKLITLPLHVDLSDSEIDFIIEAIRSFPR